MTRERNKKMRLIDADELIEETVLLEGHDEDAWLAEKDIDEAPTVDAKPVVHAHWDCIENVFSYEGVFDAYECSNCHKAFLDDLCENNGADEIDVCKEFKYCPNCGAKMDGKEDDK